MNKLPCPKCGSKDTVGTFCASCLRELHPLIRTVKPGKLVLCHACNRVHLGGAWKDISDDSAIEKLLHNLLGFSGEAKVSSVEFDTPQFVRNPGIKETVDVPIVVSGRHDEVAKDYEEKYTVPLSYDVTICPHCKKAAPTYYEGILQIRHETPEVRQAIISYIDSHHGKGLHLTKSSQSDDGTDYYLSDHRAVANLVQKLHKEFGGELKLNAQHFSENKQTSKILYRTTALLRLPAYSKGDIIKKGDGYFLITGISSNISAENLLTGQRETFPYFDGEGVVLQGVTTRVTKTRSLEVLHPETFQSVEPENLKQIPKTLEPDQEVTVVVDGSHLFFVKI